MDRVGIIGLGKMGMPIARNLAERGFEIIGYRRSGSPELIASGGVAAASPAEVAERADVLLSILPVAAAVEEVVCGEAGTLTDRKSTRLNYILSLPAALPIWRRRRLAGGSGRARRCPAVDPACRGRRRGSRLRRSRHAHRSEEHTSELHSLPTRRSSDLASPPPRRRKWPSAPMSCCRSCLSRPPSRKSSAAKQARSQIGRAHV